MGEMPAKLKFGKLCSRMSKYVTRDLRKMLEGNQNASGAATGRTLRSSKQTSIVQWAGADKKDFGDAIFVTGYEFDLSDEKFRYSAKGGEKAYVFKLDEVEKYAKEKNKEIIRVARERANGYIDWDREYVIPGFVSGQF